MPRLPVTVIVEHNKDTTMVFIKHTVNWFKGESFEGGMIILWGLLVLGLATYFWKFGHSSTIRIMIIPFFGK
jgi:hypothetical protein